MIKKSLSSLVLAVSMIAGLAACAGPAKTSKLYAEEESMQKTKIEFATVVSVKEVQIQGKTGIGGAAGGAILGGAAGAQMGQGSGQIAGAAIGALAGAAIGKVVEEFSERKDALEITVKLSDGSHTSVVQTDEGLKFSAGQSVRLVTSNGKVRVAPL